MNPSTSLRSSREVRDEEEIDRGPLPEVSESDWAAFDLARNVNKGERLARVNDSHAMDLQIQMQGCIGELPR